MASYILGNFIEFSYDDPLKPGTNKTEWIDIKSGRIAKFNTMAQNIKEKTKIEIDGNLLIKPEKS